MKENILFILGTRPEIIKLYPIIQEFKKRDLEKILKVCFTGQHNEMARSLLKYFDISPDYDLNVMEPEQSLNRMAGKLFMRFDDLFRELSPQWVIAQGDTTSVWTSAVAAFHNQIKFAHVEAGLRSRDKRNPFPEEANRMLASCVADLHFSPTELAKRNLLKEGIDERLIKVVGNTVIDTLLLTLKKLPDNSRQFPFVDDRKKLILVTLHRRENQGKPITEICHGLLDIAKKYSEIQIVFPMHFNPQVRSSILPVLDTDEARKLGIFVIEPPDYEPFVYLLKKSWLVITDSGGIQEEAPSVNKPVLIIRDVTERPECVQIGAGKLIGSSADALIKNTDMLIRSQDAYEAMCYKKNPFGDGKASIRIVDHLLAFESRGYCESLLIKDKQLSRAKYERRRLQSKIPTAPSMTTASAALIH
jgi:UDP-N-acetylglucosamine 2-epimerase (non-hydrolysing)